jgi:hypothetical protein
MFSAPADAQYMDDILMVLTSGTTSAQLTVGGGALVANVNNLFLSGGNCIWYYKVQLVGVRTDGGGRGDCAIYEINGGILSLSSALTNIPLTGGALETAGTSVVSKYSTGTGTTWTVAVAADNAHNGLGITVTGSAGSTVKWVAKVELVQIFL